MLTHSPRHANEWMARRSDHPRYQIRYRCTRHDRATALIVVGDDAAPYLFSGGRFQAYLRPHQRCERLVDLLAGCGHWAPVPPVAPYTVDELRALTDPGTGRVTPDSGAGPPTHRPRDADGQRATAMLRLPLRRERYARG